MEEFFKFLTSDFTAFGITIQYWVLCVAAIFIVWLLDVIRVSISKD
jgi:hypothetical protein